MGVAFESSSGGFSGGGDDARGFWIGRMVLWYWNMRGETFWDVSA